ncbi:MAG: pyridoxal phosphate-dependent aminotransferase [Acidobacteria bacterium]|nr:MAG: pyridoxal phosphate-dependent aminotransferase [Acidobacteriota bacterium]
MFARRTGWKLTENRYSAALHKARAQGGRLIDLTASNPTHGNFDFDSAAILSALTHRESLNYDPDPQGLLSARNAVAGYYNTKKVRGTTHAASPEQIFLTTSTSEGYSYLFRLLCDPGDEVLVARPSYPLFEFLAEMQDVQLRCYELFYDHGWHIDFGGLEGLITQRTRAVLVVNPNNPTGSFVRCQELDQIAALCRKQTLALISDEVFLDYEIEGASEASAAFSNECLSFALSGLSKISCLPQMKLAWIVVNGPAELRDQAHARLQIIADTYLSVNAPIQHALPLLLDQRFNVQPQLVRRVRNNLALLDKRLESARAIRRLVVDGGWYAVLRVPARQSDEDLAIELIQRFGVIVHPGHFYDFPQDGYIVVSLITPDEEFREGANVVIGFLDGLL